MSSTTVQSETVIASVLHGTKDLRLESRPISPPSSKELQIAVLETGICGSDLHYYNHFRNGDILVKEPLSLGHESSGVVVTIGPEVEAGTFKVGDRVALEVGLPCESCKRCDEGRYNICAGMKFRSSAKANPHAQGTLQERINHPAKWCHKLPDTVSLSQGALLEPLSVAIHAIRRADLAAGSTVLVFGAGAVGLLTAAMLRATGASKIVIADIESTRIDFATKNNFADGGFVVPRKRGETIEEKLDIAKELSASVVDVLSTEGTKFDAVFECTGVEACLQSAIYATRPGGTVLMIGMGNPIQTLPISAAALNEIDLIGVFRYANTYPYGISILADMEKRAGMPDISKLVTHRFQGLDNVKQAFEMAGKGVDAEGNLVLKVVIETRP